MRKFSTTDGGSVEFTRVSAFAEVPGDWDVHTRNAAGETISTVILPEDEAALYMTALASCR